MSPVTRHGVVCTKMTLGSQEAKPESRTFRPDSFTFSFSPIQARSYIHLKRAIPCQVPIHPNAKLNQILELVMLKFEIEARLPYRLNN